MVNRRLLNFNDKECFVINLTDISAYEDLKKQHEAYNLLKKLKIDLKYFFLLLEKEKFIFVTESKVRRQWNTTRTVKFILK